jgi:predicted permease
MLEGTTSDLRYVLRVLRQSPGFTLVAVLSLAIGIGANTAMFGVVRTLLLTPLPVDAPEQLSIVGWTRAGDFRISQTGSTSYEDPATGASYRSNFSYPLYTALRDAGPDDVRLFAFAFLRGVSVAVGDQAAVLAGGALVDGRYFSTLRPRIVLGRGIADDDRPGAPLVAVLSHSFWMRAFGGDPEVIGRTVRINGNSAEIVGVTDAGFKGLSMGGFFPQTEITVPLHAQPQVYPRMASGESLFAADDVFWLRLVARVPATSSLRATEQTLEAVFRTRPSPLIADDGHLPSLRLLPGSQGVQPVRAETAKLLYLLLGVVGIVLLIACVNLASLLLARGVSRQREMAVRQALGAGRARLIRQTLIESLVLACVGTVAGLILAVTSRGMPRGFLTGSLGSGAFGNVDMEMSIDPLVIGLCATLGVGATVLFGLLPAVRLSKLDSISWLKQRPGAGSSAPRLTAGRVLIALQISVSVPLVVGAALFLRTLANLGAVELGFDPRGLVMFQLDPGYTQLPPEEYPGLYLQVLDRLDAIPGVRSTTLLENALMSGIISNTFVDVDGASRNLYRNAVGPGFLETIGMRLLAGRVPGIQDTDDAPPVGAVNATAMEELFGGELPIGRFLRVGGRDVRIVGVVNDAPYRNQRDPVPPILYESALQRQGYGGHHIVLRTDAQAGPIEPLIREAVARVNADLPVPGLRTQADIMAQTSARERAFTQLLSLFGGFALLLASIGLHGVTSYWVTRRTSEIGVRVAVGARPHQIFRLVLRQVVVLVAVGLAAGVPASLAAGRLVSSLLYGVAATDVRTVAVAVVVILGVAIGAGFLPARRAARMDALVALRAE